ncbi:MAG: gamma carbonic anhydrase family protein [Acidobacteriota bacterium]
MIVEFNGKSPQIARNVFIAPTAVLLGDVHVAEGSSIWFGAVLRGDHGTIIVGAGSNVQDNSTVHVPRNGSTTLGENVTIGHGAVLEGSRIGRGALIGMNATLLQGTEIGEEALVAAGSVVPEGMSVPPCMLAAGVPAQVKKELSGSSLEWIKRAAVNYHRLRDQYLEQKIGVQSEES